MSTSPYKISVKINKLLSWLGDEGILMIYKKLTYESIIYNIYKLKPEAEKKIFGFSKTRGTSDLLHQQKSTSSFFYHYLSVTFPQINC